LFLPAHLDREVSLLMQSILVARVYYAVPFSALCPKISRILSLFLKCILNDTNVYHISLSLYPTHSWCVACNSGRAPLRILMYRQYNQMYFIANATARMRWCTCVIAYAMGLTGPSSFYRIFFPWTFAALLTVCFHSCCSDKSSACLNIE